MINNRAKSEKCAWTVLQNNVLCHSERSEESYIAMYL